jgi:cell division protein FtsQ
VIIKKTARRQNRRLSTSRQRRRQHLLDVKVRAKKAAAKRTQGVLFSICILVLVGSVLGGIAFGAKNALNALFFANPDYAVKTIEVHADGTLTRDTILKAVGLSEGTNIFSISLPQVQEKLANLPQVEESHIQRILPDRLAISIQERRPVAWIVPPGSNISSFNFANAYLIDHRGILLKTKSLAPEYLGLPLILGVDISNYLPGQPLEQEEVKAALELLRTASEILPARLQIQTIDVSKGYCLIVTDKERANLTFSPDQLEQQLRRLEVVLNYCDQNKKELQTVNLLAQRNIPVTFVPPADPEESLDAPEGLSRSVGRGSSEPLENTAQPPVNAAPNSSEKNNESKTKPEQKRTKLSPEQRVPRVRRAVPVEKPRANGQR